MEARVKLVHSRIKPGPPAHKSEHVSEWLTPLSTELVGLNETVHLFNCDWLDGTLCLASWIPVVPTNQQQSHCSVYKKNSKLQSTSQHSSMDRQAGTSHAKYAALVTNWTPRSRIRKSACFTHNNLMPTSLHVLPTTTWCQLVCTFYPQQLDAN